MNISEMDMDEKGNFMRDIIKWDLEKLAVEAKKKFKQYEATGEGVFFMEFYFISQILLLNYGDSSSNFFKEYYKYKDDLKRLISCSAPSMLQNYLFHGKRFIMAKPVYDLLLNTKNKIFLRKHPFPVFAIDQRLETKYNGLDIIFTIFLEVIDEKSKKPIGCNYVALGKDERDSSEFFISIGSIDYPLKEIGNSQTFSKQEEIELNKKIRELYANFLDYVNHPYSKQTLYKLSYNNEKRIINEKFPRQDKFIIDIKPEFFDINKVGKIGSNLSYKYKFWVRGHFKHFRNKIRYKKIYNLSDKELKKRNLFFNQNYLSRWVIPYIKGSGKLKEKIRRAT